MDPSKETWMKTTRKKLVLKRETLQALEPRSLRDAAAGFTGICTGTGTYANDCTTGNLTAQSACRNCV
jgi:hypothetical protein